MSQYNPGRIPEFDENPRSRAAFSRQVQQEFIVLSKIIKELQSVVTTRVVAAPSSGTSTVVTSPSAAHNILSTEHSDTQVEAISRGDALVVNSSTLWSRFALGAIGTVWKSDGTDPVYDFVQWGEIAGTLSDQTDLQDELDELFLIAVAR